MKKKQTQYFPEPNHIGETGKFKLKNVQHFKKLAHDHNLKQDKL